MATKMYMEYEFITPDKALQILETNTENRKISEGQVQAFANDILAGNWDEMTGSTISIDENGVLRDGQHRLAAIVKAGIGFHVWVCRNVDEKGIYDNNRKRSASDQLSITRPDLEKVYGMTRTISVIRALITAHESRRTVTPKELSYYIDLHKKDFDEFFLNMPQHSVAKISLAVVYLALFMAYMGGVDIETISDFYEVLSTGMSSSEQEYPIIAYRNYLMSLTASPYTTDIEIGRCQYALKKYLTKSCTKRNISPKELIWGYPWEGEKK